MAPIDSVTQDTQPYDPYATAHLDTADAAQARQQQPLAPASNPDPAQAAHDVLAVGVRSGRDDYDARMVALSDALKQGDPTYRSQLMGEILKQDSNALNSWLQPSRAEDLVASGKMTLEQEGRVAEGFASVFNDGNLQTYKIGVGPTPGTAEPGSVERTDIDHLLDGYYNVAGFGTAPDRIANAQDMRKFVDFMSSSNGPEVAEFRQKYAQHLIDQYVLNPAVGYNNPQQRDAAAGLAGNLIGGDISRPDIAAKTLAKYDFDEVKTIMESAARSNGIYSEDAIEGEASTRFDSNGQPLDARDIAVPNGAALIMDSVGISTSADADKVATELARLPANAPSIFDSKNIEGKTNTDALTLTVTNHANAVFDSLAKYDDTYIGDKDNANLQQYMKNGSELGSLFRTTLFNPDSSYRNLLQDKVTQYAGALKNEVNQPGPNQDAAGHLAMLSASLTDGVRQGYTELAKDEAAKKEMLGMVVDIALAGLPVGKWAAKPVEDLIKSTFPSEPMQEALKGLAGKLIDTPVGKLNEAAKKQIVDALGKSEGNLAIAQNLSNDLHDAFFNQVSDSDYDKEFAQVAYNQILNGIQLARK
ncbi:MAG TPA: hypothetical protein VJ696_08485 [Rhodanobacteraceae bacterium]|nr:hypothetical protein [Rhodanobacteraceae bacterium]